MPQTDVSRADQVDVLTDRSPADAMWTRVNAAEAAPGVLPPMSWTFYGRELELNTRRGFSALGMLPPHAVGYPDDVGERMFGIFHGRFTLNVTMLRRIMCGLPGVSGDDVERDLLGSARDGVLDQPYPHRGRVMLVKAPVHILRSRHAPDRNRAAAQRWWSEAVGAAGPRPGVDPYLLLREALDRYGAAIRTQLWARRGFQTAAAQITALAATAGDPHAAGSLMAGAASTEEGIVADDLWRLAQGGMSLATFLGRHGYHGPNAGNVAARSWREDPGPLERLLGALREAEAPADRRSRAAAERELVLSRVLAALDSRQRLGAKATLAFAPVTARALERTKTWVLITLDAARAAVRAAGADLVSQGRLENPEDAFHLFAEELLQREPIDWRDLVRERAAVYAACLELELPETWTGQPEPHRKVAAVAAETSRLTGLGVSPGVAEGSVRVVRDAADDVDVEIGEILVCPTTDPSWLALMTVAGALVIDIGAAASHGAIVARELGVPCVIGTRTGTVELRDGDHVRVDGSSGVVEILSRAAGHP